MEGTPQLTNQMLDLLEGYLDNIAAAATQTVANGGSLAELAASLAISVDTVARQKIEIKRLSDQISALKKRLHPLPVGLQCQGVTIFFANIVKHLAKWLCTG